MRINIKLHPFDSIRFIKCPRNPELVERTDIFEMSCTNEPAAAEMAYKAMRGK